MSSFDILGPDGFRPQTIREGIGDAPPRTSEGDEGGFASHLAEALDGVVELNDDVKENAEAIARGEPVPLHDLMISMGKSEVAFNLMLEVRNKLLEAWQVLSRSS